MEDKKMIMSKKAFEASRYVFAILALIVVFAGFHLGFQYSLIPSGSMEPTYYPRDIVAVRRTQDVHHGDIVTFYPHEVGGEIYIKRVIGLPGDTIEVKDGAVWRNGEPLEEDYIKESPAYKAEMITVPEGQFYAMGDNRNASNDSHILGCFPLDHVIGTPVFHL